MVRKRAHKRESDESEDSSDYTPDFEDAPPKKYSLRQRTRPSFIEDFDYDVDDSDLSANKQSSDDDDFDAGAENDQVTQYTNYIPSSISQTAGTAQSDNGLIDFEEMIRADIVINKNCVDYDKMINTSEIILQKPKQKQHTTTTPTSGKKRGRPRKQKPITEEDFGHSILGPLADNFLQAEAYGDNVFEPLTQVENIQAPSTDTNLHDGTDRGQTEDDIQANLPVEVNPNLLEPVVEVEGAGNSGQEENIPLESVPENNDIAEKADVSKSVPEENNEIKVETNPGESKVVDDSFVSPEEIIKQKVNVIEVDESDSVKDSNDDVILINDKPEVIVLDDD